jgi:AcrR family transcriptional regulator
MSSPALPPPIAMPSTVAKSNGSARGAKRLKPRYALMVDRTRGVGGVEEIQRARILAAMAEVCAERGAGNVTVAHVVARSGVSRRTFYELFEGLEACFLAALDEAVEHCATYVLPAYAAPAGWRERIRVALVALLEFLHEEPFLGRLMVVDTLGAGARALERRQQLLAQAIAAVEEGQGEAKRDGGSPLTAEGVVGGVLSVLHSRLIDPRDGSLLELTGPLMSMIALPYLGAACARQELQRPVPCSPTGERAPVTNPLRDLEMRLTYRTVRVLMSVAEHPGASNREVGFAAGMQDQGQTSKLLTRLKRLGLIENTGAGQVRGAPNEWTLTRKGIEVEQAVRAPIST